MAGFQRDANGRLRDMQGHFVKEGEAIGQGLGDGIRKRAAEGVDGIWRDAQGKLRTAQGRFIKEGTILGEGFGEGASKGAKKGLRGLFSDLDALKDKMGKVSSKWGGLTGLLGTLGKVTAFSALAAGAAGAASALGPLIGLVGTLGTALVAAGAAIPAFAVAGAAAVATLSIGFSNLGDAIAGDEEALDSLAPAARSVVGVLDDLRPAWESLTRSVQQRLFKGLADDLADVAGTWMPLLEDGLGTIADGFNTVATAGAKALTQTEVMQGFEDVTAATATGLKGFATGLDGWLSGIGTLLSAFSPLIAEAGQAAGDLGDRFGTFMDRVESSGQLADFIARMRDTFSTLGGVAQNVGSILFDIFAAARSSGGDLLGTIETLTGRLSTFFDSAKGQDALISFFSALSAVADAVVPIAIELADAFATDLAPHLATIATEVGPSLRDLIRELGDAIGGIDVATLAAGFADVLGAITPLISVIGSVVGWLSQVEGLVPVIVGALVLWTVSQWALNAAMYANPIVWIIALIVALIAIVVLLVANVDTVAAAMVASWEWIKSAAAAVWGWLTELFTDWWPVILALFTGGLSLLAGWIVDHWDEIKSTTSSVWNSIRSFFVAVWDAIVTAVRTHVNAALSVIDWFGDLPGRFRTWFGSVKDAAVDRLTALVTWVGSLPGKILGKLDGLAGDLLSLGKNIISGLLSGMKSQAGAVLDWVMGLAGDIASEVKDFFGISSPSRLMAGYGENIGQGLANGIASSVGAVDAATAGLTTGSSLSIDSSAGSSTQVSATASLSEEDRALLRELAASTTNFSISTDANTRVAEIRRDAMVMT